MYVIGNYNSLGIIHRPVFKRFGWGRSHLACQVLCKELPISDAVDPTDWIYSKGFW